MEIPRKPHPAHSCLSCLAGGRRLTRCELQVLLPLQAIRERWRWGATFVSQNHLHACHLLLYLFFQLPRTSFNPPIFSFLTRVWSRRWPCWLEWAMLLGFLASGDAREACCTLLGEQWSYYYINHPNDVHVEVSAGFWSMNLGWFFVEWEAHWISRGF